MQIKCFQIPTAVMDRIWTLAHTSNAQFDALEVCVHDVCAEGYPLSAIIVQLHDLCVNDARVSDLIKAFICEKIAQVDQCLVDGANEYLQFLDLLAFIHRRLHSRGGQDSYQTTH